MTRFLDGPAAGQTLMLRSAPGLLRVTFCVDEKNKEKWDALDQREDTPRRNERVFAYEREGAAGAAFIDGPGMHGVYAVASYRAVLNPPEDSVMRDNITWRKWC